MHHMRMILFIPLIVCIVGLLLYFATDAKISNVGLQMFWCGLLVTLFALPHLVR